MIPRYLSDRSEDSHSDECDRSEVIHIACRGIHYNMRDEGYAPRRNIVLLYARLGLHRYNFIQVDLGGQLYHLSDSMILRNAIQGIRNNDWFLFVDVEVNGEMLTKTAACSSPDPTLKTKVAEEKTKKRKMKTSAAANNVMKLQVVDPFKNKEGRLKLAFGFPLLNGLKLACEREGQRPTYFSRSSKKVVTGSYKRKLEERNQWL